MTYTEAVHIGGYCLGPTFCGLLIGELQSEKTYQTFAGGKRAFGGTCKEGALWREPGAQGQPRRFRVGAAVLSAAGQDFMRQNGNLREEQGAGTCRKAYGAV
jgi:hypothetical protein